MFKKLMLLTMAVGALVAFAVPASASAAQWLDNGEPFSGDRTIELEGHAEFTKGANGVTCNQAKFTMTMQGETDEGSVTAFSVTNPTTECVGKGELAPCPPEQPDPENLPWPVTVNANQTITVKHIQFKATFLFCPAVQVAEGEMTLVPDNSEEIGTLSGTGTALGEVELNADLSVLGANAGTYGIE